MTTNIIPWQSYYEDADLREYANDEEQKELDQWFANAEKGKNKKAKQQAIHNIFNRQYTKDTSRYFEITLDTTMLGYFVLWFARHPEDEIAGYFSTSDEDEMVYAEFVAVGTGGSVVIDETQSTLAIASFEKAGFPITGQFHTHPGFLPFWSSTDLGDHHETISFLRQVMPEGQMTFIVYDGTINWLTRRYWWNEEKVVYCDGNVVVNDTVLDVPGKDVRLNATSVYRVGKQNQTIEAFDPGAICDLLESLSISSQDDLYAIVARTLSSDKIVIVAAEFASQGNMDQSVKLLQYAQQKPYYRVVDTENKVVVMG